MNSYKEKSFFHNLFYYSKLFTSFGLLLLVFVHKDDNPSFSLAKNFDNYFSFSLFLYNIAEFCKVYFGKLFYFFPLLIIFNSILVFLDHKKVNAILFCTIICLASSLYTNNTFDSGVIGLYIFLMVKSVVINPYLTIKLLLATSIFVLLFYEINQQNKKFKKLIKNTMENIRTSINSSYSLIKNKFSSKRGTNSSKSNNLESKNNHELSSADSSEEIYFYNNRHNQHGTFLSEEHGFRFYKKPKVNKMDKPFDPLSPNKIFSNDLNQQLYEKIFEKKKHNFDNSLIKNAFQVKFHRGNFSEELSEKESNESEEMQNIDANSSEEMTDYHEREELLSGIKDNFNKIQNNSSDTSNLVWKPANDSSSHIERVMFQSSDKVDNQKDQINSSSINKLEKVENQYEQNPNNEVSEKVEKYENYKTSIKNSFQNGNQNQTGDEEEKVKSEVVRRSVLQNKEEQPVILNKTFKSDQTTTFQNNSNTTNSQKSGVIGKFHELISKIQSKSLNNQPSQTFKLPDINFLASSSGKKVIANHHQAQITADKLIKVLKDFSVFGRIAGYHIGPVITLYEFEPLPGTKSSRVIGLCDDIARSLSAISARISVIPGKNALGIELPNEQREMVFLKDMFDSSEYKDQSYQLPIALGKSISGEPIIVDLAKMPHLLVAGTTGSGKSVAINVMIMSILYSLKPDECKFIMIDPKMLELSIYNGIPHLLTPVVTDPKKAIFVLKWVVKEMEERYRMMSYLGVRNIKNYNEKIEEAIRDDLDLTKFINIGFDSQTDTPINETIIIEKKRYPYIVVIVDEMADLMLVAGKEIEFYIQRLAQMARAAGIHIIMATQRPSVDVITGVIKANLPTRISFAVTSKIDSRTILGEQGAEQLLGMGDMLYMASGNKIVRIHGPFISDSEVERVVNHLHSFGPPNYLDTITTHINSNDEDNNEDNSDDADQDYQRAIELVTKEKKVSISYIQRQLRIGYNKSATIVEKMEKEGIVTSPNHQGKRELVN